MTEEDLGEFDYDEANDQFICPNGDVLVMKGEYMANGKLQYSYYGANCSECPFQEECMCRKTTCEDLKDVLVQYQRKLYR